jgi:NAD+ synthase
MEGVCEKIENWIGLKVKESGAKGCVVGMSGGVDSSVVAILAKRSLAKGTLGLILTCESDPEDSKKAKLVAEKFWIETREIDLTGVFRSLKNLLPEVDRKTLGNMKARMRMLVLYYFANKYKYLVLGTSNRSELRIGYVTKYGDSGVDLEPIGDLYKTQVIELAKHLGIPKEIIESPPTAGLWKGQTDREEIGIGYENLDLILEAIDKGEEKKLDPKVLGKVKEMIRRNEHKRRSPEVCELA